MRVILFFISFCFFLLGYGSDISLTTNESNLSKNEMFCSKNSDFSQLKTKETTFNLIEYTNIELEEDYHNDDDYQTSLIRNIYSFTRFNLDLSDIVISNYHYYNPTNISLGILSLPIYLKNKVFRI